ncbi:hypothetical protein EDC01DRAFT_757614 [Geopyxis carbonaria]|nr:hypothetical protein EDC01DRAFT_757614 [Geopyxis carbonaria]
MGKAKKHGKSAENRNGSNPIGGRNPPIKSNAETEALRTEKILPVVKRLSSGSADERTEAINAACNLLEDDTCRFLLLKERIVQKLMEDLLHDPAENVVVLSWKALRIIAEKEGYDQCINIFRRDILSRIARTLDQLSVSIESTPGAEAKEIIWTCVDNIVVLLTCLSDTDIILDAITALKDVVPFLMGLLKPASKISDNTKTIVVQCLSVLTDDNDDLTKSIIETPEYVSIIISLKESNVPLIRMYTCAILHNLSLGPSEAETEVSDALVLPTVTSFIKYTASLDLGSYSPQNATNEDQAGFKAVQVALEVVVSIATALGYEMEGDPSSEEPLPEFTEDDGDDDDESNHKMGEVSDNMQEDIEMLTGDNEAGDIGSSASQSIIKYLLEITAPAVIMLSKPLPDSLNVVRLRALDALNNIAWTADAATTKSPGLSKKWRLNANEIWTNVVTPVLAANTANIELAEAITGVAWAIVKNSRGYVDLGHDQHKAFIGLYQAATGDKLRSKCVGVLGCLAMAQKTIEINKEIGVFLISLVTNAPETPAEATIEALDAIFEIYSDAEFAYDEPVFIQNEFSKYLEDSIPKIRTMVRRIDKRKSSELRQRAEEVALNLTRFVQYKKKERSGK